MKTGNRRSISRIMWFSLSWLNPAWECTATIQGGCILSFIFLSTILLWRMFRKTQNYELPARDVSKGHRWCPIDAFSNTAYCSICSSLIIDGYYCDSCGVCADVPCLKKANKELNCKALAATGSSMKHHWVKGNLPNACICDVCQADCGTEAALTDFRCCWCQRTVHKNCLNNITENCDFGRYKSFIVPPFCVALKRIGLKGRRHLIVGDVQPPPYMPWGPLIVIGNRKSGSNECEGVLRVFRSFLNPSQVIDLHDLQPEEGLQWCRLITGHACRVLVAGGDGTIGWVFNAIENLNINPQPQICILPLGTGNDLSRVLGWGNNCSGEVEVKKILDQITTASVARLDRWKITITPFRPIPIRHPKRERFMNNYASVGVDALVTLNFDKTRKSKFYLYSSRLVNKLLYLIYGAKDILERECEKLHEKIELYLDGKKVELPELEAVIVLNIPSWGAGVRPWGMSSDDQGFVPQRYDDGILEVFGVYSSFHIAQLQIGLSEPLRIGQARNVMLRLLERVPIQIDGEPWKQHPAEINIVHHSQATVLCNNR